MTAVDALLDRGQLSEQQIAQLKPFIGLTGGKRLSMPVLDVDVAL